MNEIATLNQFYFQQNHISDQVSRASGGNTNASYSVFLFAYLLPAISLLRSKSTICRVVLLESAFGFGF